LETRFSDGLNRSPLRKKGLPMSQTTDFRTPGQTVAETERLRVQTAYAEAQTRLVQAQTELEKVRADSRAMIAATVGVLLAILFGLGFVLLMARG
jgi:hypothetical protein